ncbi:MAG: hypothetical protein HY738_14740, partial [Bacteroidia bacterium]|nr:hypothetical protein [Bacteroidia bacterium]
MNNDYYILLKKLDKFIRKYYKNQIIRGLLISFSLYGFFYLFITVSEYFGHFSIITRTFVFYTVIAVFLAVFLKMICIPFLKYNKIGKIISHKQASKIISTYFSDIQDKLYNTIELADLAGTNTKSRELIFASIDQRIELLRIVPFVKAINLKENIRYFPYIVLLSAIIIAVYLIWPSILNEGTARMIHHRTFFAPAAPFDFILLNDSLSAEKGSDFKVLLQTKGKYAPENVLISYGGNNFLMKKDSKSKFSYDFKNINNSVAFFFNAEEYYSAKFRLEVLPAPVIVDFFVEINVPEYTGEKDRILNNIGDLTIPYGSVIKWRFNTKDISNMYFTFGDTLVFPAIHDSSGFYLENTAYQSNNYKISLANKYFSRKDILQYSLNVIPDLHPSIKVNTIHDSLQYSIYYFQGIINDDYGFKNLYFCYNTTSTPDSLHKLPLKISQNLTAQEFYYSFDFSVISFINNDIEYFFEVWDNDAVNGSKSARTGVYEFKIPTEEELEKYNSEANADIQSSVERSYRLAKELREDINKMREDLINDKSTSWERTQMMQQISEKQNTLEQLMEQLAKENAQKNEFMNTFSEEELEILKKQEEIQNLLENIMNDELKKLIEEFNNLLNDFDNKKLNEITKDLDISYKDIEEQLNRDLELLKQMEVEQKINSAIDQLEELAKDQQELSEQSDNRKLDGEELKNLLEKQNEQSGKFDDISDGYKEIQKKNNELEAPFKLDDFGQEIENIKNEFQQGSQNLQQNNSKKASQNQKQNSQNLQQLAQNMQNMMQQNFSGQTAENIEDLRQ